MEGTITSVFGERVNPVTIGEEVHNGLDIAVVEGTPVVAVQGGTVTEVGEDALSGIFVRFDTDNGFNVTYAHLSHVGVKTGETIAQGQIIANSGNTGRSTGPHLHYTLRKGDTLIDPAKYVNLPMTENVRQALARGE